MINAMIYCFSILFIITIVFNLLVYIKPLVIYQKSLSIINKYIFIIEKFGYLSTSELNSLKVDLDKVCTDKYELEIPTEKGIYGSMFEVEFKYLYDLKCIDYKDSGISYRIKKIPIVINRYGYIKY